MNVLLCADFDPAEQPLWQQALTQAMPEAQWWSAAQARAQPAAVQAAVVANPAPGSLQGLPALGLIQSLWAGVDRLLADPTLPAGVPIARMVDPALSAAMAETALWATLALQRGFFGYARQQRQPLWRAHGQRRADECPVLVLGQGAMGGATTRALRGMGYAVTGWSRSGAVAARGPAAAPSDDAAPRGAAARCDAPALHADAALCAEAALHASAALQGEAALRADAALCGDAALWQALPRAQVLINLLPLTAQTAGLLNARLFAALPRGAGLVNLARGRHVVDADLLAALDSGHIDHAVLDVFHQEPLPRDHPYWRHERVTLLPHVAAQTDPRSAAAVVAANLRALREGRPLQALVARDRGY